MCKIFLAVILLAFGAPLEGGAAMLVAARESFAIANAKRWRNPYITDGLIAMWDGEWNAGGGVHDANARTWVDVVSGLSATSSNPMTVTDNAMVKTGDKTMAATLPQQLANNIEATLEVCMGYVAGNSGVFSSGAISALFKSDNRLYFSKGINSQTQRSTNPGVNFAATVAFVVTSANVNIYKNANRLTTDASAGTQAATRTLTLGWGRSATNATTFYCYRFYARALGASVLAANHAIDRERFSLP